MATQELEQPVQNLVTRNTKRIDHLIHEVEKLIDLLERQRLVEPSALLQVKRELHAIAHEE